VIASDLVYHLSYLLGMTWSLDFTEIAIIEIITTARITAIVPNSGT